MPRVLVIGFGNPLRGDDAAGALAAEEIARTHLDLDLEVRVVHQLTPELAWDISQAARVIFLDARAGGEPGEIVCERLRPGPRRPLASMHSLGPIDLIASAHLLYGAEPEAWLLTVAGERFEHGEDLSPRVRAAMKMLIASVDRMIGVSRAA